jgi:prepilin-type N-terminal cleavage/methylation domain-containing protein
MASRCRRTAACALKKEDGVTLIELLVVLIIIGVLAAIGIAIFTNQQNKAHDADAKTGARSAQTAMETYFVEHKSYVGASVGELQAIQPSLTDAPNLAVRLAGSNQYQLDTTSDSTIPVTFKVVRSASGTITRSCNPSGAGGCPNGSW